MNSKRQRAIEFVANYIKNRDTDETKRLMLIEQSTYSKRFKDEVIKRIQNGRTSHDLRSQQG